QKERGWFWEGLAFGKQLLAQTSVICLHGFLRGFGEINLTVFIAFIPSLTSNMCWEWLSATRGK
ncbi:MAG: hypothetical protein II132_00510, partial [Desulfovibrio sp.]|nr:hypothetical protein [Desulfovibrio sp.]